MKKKYIIKTLLKDFLTATLPTIITRDYQIPIASGKIITLIGARRSGKSFLLYQLVKKITVRVPKQQII
ncbi:MAG: hypothetical protein DRR16_24410 [Candidatus Parabeggiatoa sp. nov. 3]|nr:MAG: hypothetical protein DRR00_02160 [Gammaproteobacteria bacterium]RKZ69440.1 MAG: hypothetical protein DRQ99_00885 [Gammaproteobacteria bacterium]RKZ80141.1 MAG: hypothetical protein DRR16_24410 [Gammaproteobacteria bacterium]